LLIIIPPSLAALAEPGTSFHVVSPKFFLHSNMDPYLPPSRLARAPNHMPPPPAAGLFPPAAPALFRGKNRKLFSVSRSRDFATHFFSRPFFLKPVLFLILNPFQPSFFLRCFETFSSSAVRPFCKRQKNHCVSSGNVPLPFFPLPFTLANPD